MAQINPKDNSNGLKLAPKNYSFVVQLTALSSSRGCQICRQANDEFSVAANSYWRQVFLSSSNQNEGGSSLDYATESNSRLFFGSLDYDEGSDIFQSLGMNSAPVFLFFSPNDVFMKKKPTTNQMMDIQRIGFSAETIGKWILEKDEGIPFNSIKIERAPNYSSSFALLILFSMISALFYLRRNNLDFLFNRTSWALAALVRSL